jgi:hypothetical protein
LQRKHSHMLTRVDNYRHWGRSPRPASYFSSLFFHLIYINKCKKSNSEEKLKFNFNTFFSSFWLYNDFPFFYLFIIHNFLSFCNQTLFL